MADGDSVRIIRYHDAKVTLLVAIERSGTLVLGDFAYPGWRCHVTDTRSNKRWAPPISHVKGVFRGVLLTPGTYSVSFEYQPTFFRVGAAVSLVSWISLFVVIAYGSVAFRSAKVRARSRSERPRAG
jgi:uncharacterized membrane protein YfhO